MAARRLKETLTCSRCGATFHPIRQNAHRGPQQYCSRKCADQPMTLQERFDRYADKSESGCWEWRGQRDKDGYGVIGAYPNQRKNMRATHAAWILYRGSIPQGMHLCHHCDNPPCCNPDHLFLGTEADNKADAARKGRMPRGEKNALSKLTSAKVIEIRAIASTGMTYAAIARQFAVDPCTIKRAITRETWKHI